MQVQHDLLDIIRCAAVVVDDGNTGDGLQQLARLDLIGPVRVDDDEQTARVGLDKRVLSGNENVLIVLILPQLGNEASGHVVLEVDDDVRGLPALAAEAPDAGRRAERVKVSHAVAHDEDLAGLRDELGQRSGHDAGFHARMPLRFLRASAVEREVVAILDDGLIAAAGQRHLDGEHRKGIVFFKRRAVLADAERDRRGDAGGVLDGADGVQQREFPILKLLQILGFEDEQIAVALDLAADRVQPFCPRADGVVDLCVDLGDGGVRQVVRQFVVVVDEDDGYDRARAHELVADIEHLGHVSEKDGREHDGRRVVLRADIVAVYAVTAAIDGLVTGQLAPSLAEPRGREAGDDAIHRLIARRVGQTCDAVKAGVAPDDLVVRQTDDRHGERRPRVDGDAECVCCALDVVHQDVLAPDEANAADDEDRDRDHKLGPGEIILVEQGGRRRKGEQHEAVPDGAGLEHARNVFVQIEFLSFGRSTANYLHYNKMLPRLQAAHLQNFCPLMYHGEKNDHPCRRMGGLLRIVMRRGCAPSGRRRRTRWTEPSQSSSRWATRSRCRSCQAPCGRAAPPAPHGAPDR